MFHTAPTYVDPALPSTYQPRKFYVPPSIILLLLIALAFGLRVYKSGVHGIYLDEKLTLVCTQGVVYEGSNQHDVFFTPGKTYFTPAEFWKPKTLTDYNEAIIRSDISNSPAYTAMLSAWIDAFGISDFSIRFPSVLFSTFIVILIYVLARRYLKSEPLALLCAFLAAIEPFFIAYSHMARSYCTTISMSLLATYLFLCILDRRAEGKQPIGLYIGYGLAFALTMLGHYLGALVFVCHGLYMLLYVRDWRTYVGLLITGVTAFLAILPWFVIGGGKYVFMTMAYQAQFYKKLADTNPFNNGFGLILPTTIINVFRRMELIVADLFMLSNGVTGETLGFRNLLVATVLGIAATAFVYQSERRSATPSWVKVAVPLLLVVGYSVYTTHSPRLLVAAALPLFVLMAYRAVRSFGQSLERRFLVLMGLLTIVPTLFIVVMAFRNGHTYGITQRYTSFSFPYAIVLVGMTVWQIFREPAYLRWTLSAILLIQLGYVAKLLNRVYEDQASKYTYFGRYRDSNPYARAADQPVVHARRHRTIPIAPQCPTRRGGENLLELFGSRRPAYKPVSATQGYVHTADGHDPNGPYSPEAWEYRSSHHRVRF
ncbi:glycosyltransferase family 39 protein [Spirosoma rhododendri]|uniref:glycosyltransferase family 39 protein n=1 Tax=Spirosoma rhododendri TaxID=2728024 RepID=UPI0020C50486|nr:glycosyltransferase family 39 protein [Spirosoma rhododendri]